MTVNLITLKTSLRIDDDDLDDDALLTGYLNAANTYILNATGLSAEQSKQADIADLFDTAVMALASGYYTARANRSLVQLYEVDLPVNSIIGQLRGVVASLEAGETDGD
ncbi:phage gp6-like head-tail connector protein [Lactobacillus sp. LC28-10]|uniref:Phage gp6-like head-tail connector protein n=1 Tax=Secundilactobacillus angelensis TaxID=2722706 RepID=A0ABX1KUS1_9LACO|nr:head-tail connector protein [Secundilactobacillus angelensis]MCH5461506.1 head-tail connector protein [Secundilactobacillus angelensis]NLR17681.1 phage gp6-like head-tail connector protein [Secundilactobacillus angelensis]